MNHILTAQQAIKNAAASVEMEGLTVTAEQKELCGKLLNKEITKEEYKKYICELAREQCHVV